MDPPKDENIPSRGDPRGTIDLVGHVVLPTDDLLALQQPVSNVIISAKTDRGRWLESSMCLIGPNRSKFRSTYFHWALAINGLHVAAAKYEDPAWKSTRAFTISGLRGVPTTLTEIARWDGSAAAEAHRATIPKMAAWGFIELYAVLETFIFDMYCVRLTAHPDELLKGDDFRALRQLRKEATADPSKEEQWKAAWEKRLEHWQRKRLYDGLHKVFLAYFTETRLKPPPSFKFTGPKTWAESMELLGLVRHSLIHNADTVSPAISALCEKPYALGFDFKEGERLTLELLHLQAFECFTDQLLDALNRSFVEHPDAGA